MIVQRVDPAAVRTGKLWDPGPAVAGRKTFAFSTSEFARPRWVVTARWRCIHCGAELSTRSYPDLAEPAVFVDCWPCGITWELTDEEKSGEP